MNDKRIEDFATVSTLQDDDLFLVGGNGETFKTTFYDIKSALGIGGGNDIDALIDRTITSIYNSTVSEIGGNAFAGCSSLTIVSFPVATIINYSAFANCYSLTTVSFPAATYIGFGAFSNCTSLTTVSFSVVTYMDDRVFQNCTSLTTASFPAATRMGVLAFANCTSLTTASFPAATRMGASAFASCTSLTTVSFPAVTEIYSSAFYNCRSLSVITLTASSVCRLYNSNAFSNTALTNIYVPASLVSAYQSASNWSYFASLITGI